MDLNSDLGEGAASDNELLAIVTSANIACGYHAGDAGLMRATVREALRRGVAIGAHPGYHDREGFGRRELSLSPHRIESEVLAQLRELEAICGEEGAVMSYVKPHGALYNRCARDADAARAVVAAVCTAAPSASILALAGSALLHEGRSAGLAVYAEAFADRGYAPSGELLLRRVPGALITDPDEAAERALSIASGTGVRAADGTVLELQADSICVHGDTPGALAIASRIRSRLVDSGMPPAPFARMQA